MKSEWLGIGGCMGEGIKVIVEIDVKQYGE